MGVDNDADNNSNAAGDGRATSLGRIIIIIAAVDATNNMGARRVLLLLFSEMTQIVVELQ